MYGLSDALIAQIVEVAARAGISVSPAILICPSTAFFPAMSVPCVMRWKPCLLCSNLA